MVICLPQNKLKGWQTCGCDSCNTVIREWKSRTTVPEEKLKAKHGESVIVKRSSGEIENNWEIFGDAYLENKIWWLTVRHSAGFSKTVPLTDFLTWNNAKEEIEIVYHNAESISVNESHD